MSIYHRSQFLSQKDSGCSSLQDEVSSPSRTSPHNPVLPPDLFILLLVIAQHAPEISFLVTIQAVAIQALRYPVNQPLTPWVPPSDAIQVRSVTNSGNGCPQGSVNPDIAPNRTLLTFGFDYMRVYIGPGLAPSYKTKNCVVHTSLESRSQAASFAVATVTYKLLARLNPGINLTVYGAWLLQDTTTLRSFSYTVNNTDWTKDYILSFRADTNVPPDERFGTPCGDVGTFTLNMRGTLQSANAIAWGRILNDMSREGLMVQVGLDWRQYNEGLT